MHASPWIWALPTHTHTDTSSQFPCGEGSQEKSNLLLCLGDQGVCFSHVILPASGAGLGFVSCAQFNSHATSEISSLQFPLIGWTTKQTQISRSCFYTPPSNFPASPENTDILRDEEADGCEQPLPLIPFPNPPSRIDHTASFSSLKPIPSPPARFFSTPPACSSHSGRQGSQGRSPGAGHSETNPAEAAGIVMCRLDKGPASENKPWPGESER